MTTPRLLLTLWLTTSILAISPFSASAQASLIKPTTKGRSLKATDSLNQFLQRMMAQRRIPGLQLAIIQQGTLIKLGAYGLANIQDSIPVTQHTPFPINSITKAFVGVATIQLVEAGKLHLEAPVSTYLDSLPAPWQAVTLRQLLTHTSGLPNIMTNNEKMVREGEEKQAWTQLLTQPMEFRPGERFSYNQTNYLLIGQVITKVAQEPFPQFIQKNQLDKAGMARTRFADDHQVIPHSARGYTFSHNMDGTIQRTDQLSNVFEEFPPFLRTASGMSSTAEELARWLIALQQHQLLPSSRSLTTLWTPGLLNDGNQSGFSRFLNGYALGWPTITRGGHRAVAPIGGGRSALFYYPDDNLAVIVLTNLQGSFPESFMDEIAGYFLPDMRVKNGFGSPASIKRLSLALAKAGFDRTGEVVANLLKKDSSFHLEETDLNEWGYGLLNQLNEQEAIAIFRLNVQLFPQSANAYDSLAEAYEQVGNRSLALEHYQTSLRLNPQNTHAQEHIKQLTLVSKTN